MSDINSFTITGRLTKDAEFKTLASGKSLLVANAAVNTGYGDFKKTLFVKVQLWGERGKHVAEYLTKGTLIGCTGEVTLSTWTSKQNGNQYTDLQIDTNDIRILSSKAFAQNKDTQDNSTVDEDSRDSDEIPF